MGKTNKTDARCQGVEGLRRVLTNSLGTAQ